MILNHDVVAGKFRQAKGSLRRTRGQLTRNWRDRFLGNLQYHAGRLQVQRGRVVARLQNAAKSIRRHKQDEHGGRW
jgi:uncharacterized protein YjbJ (UPF0337 family)